MKLHVLVVAYLTIFRVQCSETASNESEEIEFEIEAIKEPLYPHNIGISNPKNNCYMNSLISCLYTIPFFQNTVFDLVKEFPADKRPEKSKSTLMALANVFAKMRLGKWPISLNKTMFPATKKSFGWTVGENECVLEFWGRFAESMPNELKEMFQAKAMTNIYRKSDNKLITSVPDVYNYITVPVPESTVRISELIARKFLDERAEDFIVYPNFQHEYNDCFPKPLNEKINVPVRTTVTFTNTPNILAFGVRRLNYNVSASEYEVNEVPIDFDNFVLNGEAYVLMASVIYCPGHYYAIVRDLAHGQFFLHNDLRALPLDIKDPDEAKSVVDILSKQSTLVFYIKKSAAVSIQPEVIVAIKANTDIPEFLKEEEPKRKASKTTNVATAAKSSKGKSNGIVSAHKSKRRKSNKIQQTTIEEEVIAPIIDENEENFSDEFDSISSLSEDEMAQVFEKAPFEETPFDETPVEATYAWASLSVVENILPSENIRDLEQVEEVDEAEEEYSISSDLLKEFANEPDLYTFEDDQDQPDKEEEEKILWEKEAKDSQAAEKRKKRMAILAEKRKTLKKRRIEDAKIYTSAPLLLQNPIPNLPQLIELHVPRHPEPTQQPQNQHSFAHQQQQHIFEHQNIFQQLQTPENPETVCETYLFKLMKSDYLLGSENFSFSSNLSRSYALELVLTSFASNSVLVKKIFSSIKPTNSNQFEYLIGIALVQMLIGAKEISLYQLNFFLRNFGHVYILDIDEGDLNTKINRLLTFFSSVLNSQFMTIAFVKTITYSELDTDEPTHLQRGPVTGVPVLNPNILIPTRPSKIPGFSVDENNGSNRVRHVYTSAGLIFPIMIDRANNQGIFNDKEIFSKCEEYSIIGGLFYDVFTGQTYSEFLSNHETFSSLRFSRETGGIFTEHSAENYPQYFVNSMNEIGKKATFMFIVQNDCYKVEPLKTIDIPVFLVNSALASIYISVFNVSEVIQTQATVQGGGSVRNSDTVSRNFQTPIANEETLEDPIPGAHQSLI